MAVIKKLTQRYNPHKIQKQARNWPVFISHDCIEKDVYQRHKSAWSGGEAAWSNPFSPILNLDPELISEFGIDACRLASLNLEFMDKPLVFLESSFKWLSKFWQKFNHESEQQFHPEIWLEASLRIKDRFHLKRENYGTFAEAKKAFKISPPTDSSSILEKQLVLNVIYPFAPCLSRYLMEELNLWPMTPAELLINEFRQFRCIRYSIGNSGWNWVVLPREKFDCNPEKTLLQISRLKNSLGSFKFNIKKLKEGYKICLKSPA